MSDAITEFINTKERSGLRKNYIKTLRLYLKAFASGRNDKPVSAFTSEDVEHWFASRQESKSTQSSNLGRLSSFFEFCRRRRWIAENPCDFIERVRIDRESPHILTPDQVRAALFQIVHQCPQFLIWFVLGVFVGLRPSEILRISRAEISSEIEQRIIIIRAAATKTRCRRIVYLSDQATVWIQIGLKARGRETISAITMRRRIRQVRDWLSMEAWRQDLLRHTALSYQLADLKDAGKVALSAGNSPKILLTHYNGLVTPAQLADFKKIMP